MRDRLSELKILQRNLLYLLNKGASPYKDNSELAEKITGRRFKKSHASEVSSPISFSFEWSDAVFTYYTPSIQQEQKSATIARGPATLQWNPATLERDPATNNCNKIPQQNSTIHATTVQQSIVAKSNPQPTFPKGSTRNPQKTGGFRRNDHCRGF